MRVVQRLVVLVSVVAAAAFMAPSASARGPSGAEAAERDFTGLVTLPNGRRIYLECHGRGSPTVMLEGGLHATADVWSVPEDPSQPEPPVLPTLAATTRVCAYDRPGTAIGPENLSRSDPVRMPRTTGAMVTDLRALQRAAKLRGPYVFVAHSMGGMIARQYTTRHPESVAGMVLVEALPETMETDLSISDWNAYDQLLLAPVPVLGDYPDLETVDFRQSFAEIRRAGAGLPRRIPFIVISRGQTLGIPGTFGSALEAAWQRGQERLAHLQPRTPHLVSEQSGHEIEVEDPQIVIDATKRVIEAVRDGHSTVR